MITYDKKNAVLSKLNRYFDNNISNKPLLINCNNRKDYHEYVNLSQNLSHILKVSSFCDNYDTDPNKYQLFEQLGRLKNNTTLLGYTTYFSLNGENEVDKYLRKLITKEYKCKLVVICYQMERNLRNIWSADHRTERQIVLIDGERDKIQDITFVNCKLNRSNITAINGFQNLLMEMEKNEEYKFVVMTNMRKNQYPNSIISINELGSDYDLIVKYSSNSFNVLDEKIGNKKQWAWLNEKLNDNKDLNEVFLDELGTNSNFELIFSSWLEFTEMQKWLYTIALKKVGTRSNKYLQLALDNVEKYNHLLQSVFRTILDVDLNKDEFLSMYELRKTMLKNFTRETRLIVDYCNASYIKDSNRIYYLTDNTTYEKHQIILCLSKYRYSNGFFQNELKFIYPDLKDYLSVYWFNMQILDDYFQDYKKLKVTNEMTDKFISKVKKNAVDRKYNAIIPLRSEKIESIDKTDTYTYFVDALGVEFLAYIINKCEKLHLYAKTTICRSNLPSITSENKEFISEFDENDFSSIKDLDKLKHHGEGDYDYQQKKEPIYIVEELSILDKILRKAQEKISSGNYKKVILISDHGASRFAVTNAVKLDWLDIDMKGIHNGRCCKISNNEIHNIEFATIENNYCVLADYSRLKGSRAASVETHGGATLEEMIVPIVELSMLDINYEVLLISDVIKLQRREPLVLKLFSKTKLAEVTLKIGEKIYVGDTNDFHNYSFNLEDIKRKGTYKASLYSNNNIIMEEIIFKVEKGGMVEKDLF